MSIKAKLEAIIYAAEEPITLDQMAALLKEDLLALKTAVPATRETASEGATELQPQPEQPEDHLGAVEETTSAPPAKKTKEKSEKAELRALLKPYLEELVADYAKEDRGIEIREVANGYRMSTKPEHHDVVRAFSKSLKPPIRLSLQALETLAVIAYKQPVTVPEISDIRGVDASGVIGTLLDRKLITTAGRKAVVGRPILYKTTKEFLMRFGLSDVGELPSMEEFDKLAGEALQVDDFGGVPDATGVPDVPNVPEGLSETRAHSEDASPSEETASQTSEEEPATATSQSFTSPTEPAPEDGQQEDCPAGFPADV